MRRRGGFQRGIAFGQPATVEHLEPLSKERTSGPIEVGRAGTCVGRRSGAASLEVCAQQVNVFRREHLRELRARHPQVRPVEADRPRWNHDPERPRGHAAEQALLPLDERHEPMRAGLRRDEQKYGATILIDPDWMLVVEDMRLDR